MRNIVAIEKGLALVPPGAEDNADLAASLQAELMQLGCALDAAAYAAASRAPLDWLTAFHAEVLPHLRKRMGADRAYPAFYRNFPAEVMETSDMALFVNAIVHYWSGGAWEPPQALVDRGYWFENVAFRPIRLGTDEDLKRTFTQLVSLNAALTAADKQFVAWAVDAYPGALAVPEAIPFRETLCILAARGLDVQVRSPTDVLRVAVHMSGGDVSLPAVPKPNGSPDRPHLPDWFIEHFRAARLAERERFKFAKFSRPQRRLILGLLERTSPDPADMQAHLGRWLRLGEVLHVGELAVRFPKAAAAFDALRNQRKGRRVRTFNARVDLAFAASWRAGVELLATRPGLFARRLDWMLRSFEPPFILDALERVGVGINGKVLVEMHGHFALRLSSEAPRTVMLKGARARMKTLPALPPMDGDLVRQVGDRIVRMMLRRAAALPPLGKVWIDDRLRQVPVPFAMRGMNTAVRTYVRGTRVPFRADAKVVRPFIHWFDEHGNQDLDLSAGLYDDALNAVAHISFTNLKVDVLNCCHSGDIRHRQGACAEYVDLDIDRCLAHGVRYAVVQAFNYNARPMHTVAQCVFGLMEREDAIANEIFVPKTISNCMPLANEGTGVAVCVVDLQAREYIWADVESNGVLPTLETAAGATGEVLRALIRGGRMSAHELLSLHARARGTVVADAASADVALRWEDLVTDYALLSSYVTF